MKKNNGFLKRRIIAIALSVITLSSFTSISLTTASAATSSTTISAVVNKNTYHFLNGSTKEEKQAIKNIKEIKKFVDDYKEKSEKSSKEAKAEARKKRIDKCATAGVSAVNNIVKGEYVSAVKDIVNLFPYGGVISGVIDLCTTLFTPDPTEPELVPSVSLEEVKEQLNNIETSINSLKEAVKQNENNEFYKCMNQILLVYNSKGSVITHYLEDKAELLNAKNILEAAQQEKDAGKIKEAENAVKEAESELEKSQKLIDNFFGDENINDFYDLHRNLRQCTQCMNGTGFKIDKDKAEGNPFLINFNAKINGASEGTSIDSIIEQCIKENEAIWNYYELGITMYSVLAPSYINYLNEQGQTKKAEANKQAYSSFMTGVYPSESNKIDYDKNNATDVHDYYMSEIIPEMLKRSGMYKFDDGTIGEKVAEVTCNGQTKMFNSFEKAWDYATDYTNTKITVFKDLELKQRQSFKTSDKVANNIELDFQGHKITGAKDGRYIFQTSKEHKGTLTIKNGTNVAGFDLLNNKKGTIKVENCIFRDSNGAIVSSGNLEMSNCTIENYSHEVTSAAIIKIEKGTSKFNNCTFRNNSTLGNGGAIYYSTDLDTQKMYNCTFTNNHAGGDGGAIHVSAHTDIEIYDSTFTGNKCDGNGGAIYLGQLFKANNWFKNVTIENNQCGKEGGGVYANANSFDTADIKLFGWNKIRYNTNASGDASNAKMIKANSRTVFKVMDDFDPYNSDIRGTTNKDGSGMVFLNSSSKYTYYYNYYIQRMAFKADNGTLKQDGNRIYWNEK